jgi:hypothetical protein
VCRRAVEYNECVVRDSRHLKGLDQYIDRGHLHDQAVSNFHDLLIIQEPSAWDELTGRTCGGHADVEQSDRRILEVLGEPVYGDEDAGCVLSGGG